MELLLGVLTTGLVELVKLLGLKFNKEVSKKIVLGSMFALVFVFTFLTTKGFISPDTVKTYLEMAATSVATYQLIVKPFKAMLTAPDSENKN